MNRKSPQLYHLFGLTVASAIPIPEAKLPQDTPDAADVIIEFGQLPLHLEDPIDIAAAGEAAEGQLLLNLGGLGRMLVSKGDLIRLEPGPDYDEKRMRLYVLGSGFGALLQQRGKLVLHGSTIRTAVGAVSFIGASGDGKSTLARGFLARGHAVVSDDVTSVDFDALGRPYVVGAYPQLKLCDDTARQFGESLAPDARILPEIPKVAVPLRDGFHADPLPLKMVFVVDPQASGPIAIDRLSGGAAVAGLINHTFRELYLRGMGLRPRQFLLASKVAESVEVYHIRRPRNKMMVAELLGEVASIIAAKRANDS